MKESRTSLVDELRECQFIRFIRKRKKKRELEYLLWDRHCLFIPCNEAILPKLHDEDIGTSILSSSSIEHQLMKRVDQIHYESVSRRFICIVGQDIRTEQGFPRERHLTVLKSYDLSISDVNTLFGLSLSHEVFSSPPLFTFFLTNGLFVHFPHMESFLDRRTDNSPC